MKRIIAIILAITMGITAVLAGFSVMYNRSHVVKAEDKNSDVNGYFNIPVSNRQAAVGTEGNPFVVLEVVPNASKASFGYLVKGQEPVDMEKLKREDRLEELDEYLRKDNSGLEIDRTEFETILLKNVAEGSMTMDEYNKYSEVTVSNSRHYGEFVYVGAKKGDYLLKETGVTRKNVGTYYRPRYEYVYSYMLGYAGSKLGDYEFVGLSYANNSKVDTPDEKAEYTWSANVSFSLSQAMAHPSSYDRVKGYIDNDMVKAKPVEETANVINTDLFKKYGLGLAYKDNDITKGEDVETYEFLGWYYDRFGVNRYDEAKPIKKDTNIYAKWRTVYAAGARPSYKISFDKNCDDENVVFMQETDEEKMCVLESGVTVEEGSQIAAPEIIPKRLGYVFDGWYTDALCLHPYDYGTKIRSDLVLYAGWREDTNMYTIAFDANTGTMDDTPLPSVVENYCANGRLSDLTLPADVFDPVRAGYTFNGWYYNKACTKAFNWDETLPDNITTDTIVVYAGWVPNDSVNTYKLKFNLNKPADAINSPEMKDEQGHEVLSLSAELSGYLETGYVSKITPHLKGNIQAKLDSYQIRVITVTPADLNGSSEKAAHNRELIDRANMIVMNQTCNNDLVELWKDDMRNKSLFCQSGYDLSAEKFGDDVDINWSVCEKIWKKVAAGTPLIYDYKIFSKSEKNGSASQHRIFSDGVNTSMNYYNATNKNVHKLFYLTNQMNPVTLYNGYLAYPNGDSSRKVNWSKSYIDSTGAFHNENGAEAVQYWNNETLIPYETILYDDFIDENYKSMLSSLGFNDEPSIEASTMRYRSIVTYGNMIHEFMTGAAIVGDMDMKEYMDNLGITSDYTVTDGVYYLLNSSMTTTNVKRNLNVLEIQPSAEETIFKNSAYWYWYIARYITNYQGTITTERMSMPEFIGKNVDLNAVYDVINIGGNVSGIDDVYKGGMAKASQANGNPNNVYSYAHSGNVINSTNLKRYAGTINDASSPVTRMVYSGNDITKVKMREILEYAKTGYPVVFGRDLLKTKTLIDFDDITINNIDTDKIDKATYIYSMIKTMLSSDEYKGSYFFENQYNSTEQNKKFTEALTIKKFSIDVVPPKEYKDRTLIGNGSLADKDIYINGLDINDKTIRFSLKINSKEDSNYIAKLYIDTNADGKYSEEEKLDSLEIFDKTNNRYVRFNKLVRDHEYIIERTIDDYVGAIPWSLDIIDSENEGVRCNKQGMCAIKTVDKFVLNILQINTNPEGTGDSGYVDTSSTMFLPTNEEIAKGKYYNSGNDITLATKDTFFNKVNTIDSECRKGASRFYYYMSRLDDFEINITRLTVNEFNQRVAAYPNFFKNNKEGPGGTCIPFNMLIIGFADCFADINNDNSLRLIEKYINEGNSVLFTHDTTSFVNSTKAQFKTNNGGDSGFIWWGYNINKYYRSILGMDRYDVKTNKGSKSLIAEANDFVFANGYEQSEKKYITASSGTTTDSRLLNQGFTDFVLNGFSGNESTNKVSKVNNGQVSSYPYKLQDTFSIANTHSQYYQLDLETDDIVVWYTLSNKADKGYGMKNDVRNNYYIYNKGNITYSGVGHNYNLSDEEVKLFVNTMVAAYNSAVLPAIPVITNSDKSTDGNETDYLYVDYDETLSDEAEKVAFGEGIMTSVVENIKNINNSGVRDSSSTYDEYTCKRTYFTLKNNSIVLNKHLTIHYYPVVTLANGTEMVLDGKNGRPLCNLPFDTYDYDIDNDQKDGTLIPRDEMLDNRVAGTPVEAGDDYYVDVPIDGDYYNILTERGYPFYALSSGNKFKIQMQVYMRYGKDIDSNAPLTGIRNVVYMKRGNFLLD